MNEIAIGVFRIVSIAYVGCQHISEAIGAKVVSKFQLPMSAVNTDAKRAGLWGKRGFNCLCRLSTVIQF